MMISKTMIYILVFLFNLPVFSQSFAHCNIRNYCSTQHCGTDPCKVDTHKTCHHKEDQGHKNTCSHLSVDCFCPLIDTQMATLQKQSIQSLLFPSFSKSDVTVHQLPAFYQIVLLNQSPETNNSLYILQSKFIC